MPLGRDIGQKDADLAIVLLAQPTTPLPGDAATVGALLGEAAGVEHQDSVGVGQFVGDMPTQFVGDGPVVPGPGTDEILEILAGDAGLGGDGLDTFSFQAAEQALDKRPGMPTLLLAGEEREVALEEVLEVVGTALDVVG